MSLGALLFLLKSVSAKHTRNYNKFCSSIGDEALSSQESDNLRQLLNFIRRSSEFHPLVFSVILPEFRSSLVELLLRHVAENSIETWILVVRDLSSLDVFIYWQSNLWKVGNQYLIIFTGNVAVALWERVFRNLWKRYNVYRVIVVDDDFRCLTRYAPFEISDDGFGKAYKSCLKTNPTKQSGKDDSLQNSLKDQTEYSDIQLDADTRLFENFRNLNGYPVEVLVFESLLMNVSYDDQNRLKLSKPDANVVFALEEAMRAKFRIKAMRKIDFKDDPFRISLDGIEAGKYDMIITGFFIKVYNQYQKFQFTCPMYEDRLCFLSPDSGLVPKAYMPFLPFQRSLWFLLMAYNVVITFLWCLVEYISESLRRPRSISRRSSINRLTRNQTRDFKNRMGKREFVRGTRSSDLYDHKQPPEIPRYVERLFTFVEYLCYPLQASKIPAQRALLFGTLFFGLIVNGLYQSVLVSSLSKPFHYPQLHTLEDVVDSGKIVFTKYANLKNVFLDDSELFQRIHVISTQRSTRKIVAYDDKIAITRYYTMELEDFDYYDKEGNSLLNLVDECPLNYRVSYVTRLHSPYAERVDFLLLRLREAGLQNFWFGNMLFEIKRRKTLDNEERRIRLSLEHYSLTLLLLFVGLLGSVLTFLVELYVAKRSTSSVLLFIPFILGSLKIRVHVPSLRHSCLSLPCNRIMALERCLLSIVVITISIAVSPIFTWNPDINRYESYNLEKGPVFYEAYYPDANEKPRGNYQEKRYFDQGTILEKTYQVPSEHLAYPGDNIQLDNYQNRADTIRNDNRFFFETNARPLDVKEISKLARRAITRDLENWNTIENYLDHAKYQDLVYRRQYVIPERGYRIEEPIRRTESNLPDPLNEQRDLRRDLYEEVREEPLALSSRVESNEGQRRLTVRDLTNKDSLGSFRSIRYEDQSPREQDVIQAVRTSQINAPSMRNTDPSNSGSIVNPYPTENIFAPRPQVINYIFSRKSEIKENAENKVQSLPETKETGERMPRNYGDNLIQDEMRKTTEDKDVKVTSIEVSEVPRHKTRHHHGEWPKRDYPRRHQS